ncbi:MAG: hypothetical protein WB780_22375 [Candidatus Acidiferrales bacterium]
MSVADIQSGKMLLQLFRGEDKSPTAEESEAQINPTGANLSEERRLWAQGLRPNDSALDWILQGPDEIFCKRVEAITGISPIATPKEREDFANRILSEAFRYVRSVRDTVDRRIVTLDECLSIHAKSSDEYRKWTRPTRLEALKICIGYQTEDGWDIK